MHKPHEQKINKSFPVTARNPKKAFSGVVFRVFRVAGAPGLPVFVVISWV